MFGWLCRATCSFVSTSFNVWCITCYPKWEALEFAYKVIGEVLVLGLLVVVHKIPYSMVLYTGIVEWRPQRIWLYHIWCLWNRTIHREYAEHYFIGKARVRSDLRLFLVDGGHTRITDGVYTGVLNLFERSEFLIDTSPPKNPSACARVPRARVHVCNNLGFSVW